ncbi:MAG: O-antigen ligase family protein, partial [Anaerolineales bacterium]|nr:O-antigen ligase family protein [Anaerolineales bacterium]
VQRRISGPIGDPNFYAQILVVIVPLALDRLWHEKVIWLRGLAAWSLAACTLAILFTFSRGGFLALVVVLGVMFFIHRPSLSATLLTLGVAVVMLRFAPDGYLQRILSITDVLDVSVTTDQSVRGRASENAAAWMMFVANPIGGVGLNQYPVNYQTYSRLMGMDPRRENRSPHSLYLQILAETGLAGLLTYGTVVVSMFAGLFEARRRFTALGQSASAGSAVAVGVALVGYLVAAIFLHAAYARYFWLLFGLALAIWNIARHEWEASSLVGGRAGAAGRG